METTTTHTETVSDSNENGAARAAVNGLAVVGFIALLILGIAGVIYSTRFLPSAFSGIGSAAVSLSSVFTSSHPSNLQVVPPPTTVPFGGGASTTMATTSASAATTTKSTPPPRVRPPAGGTAGVVTSVPVPVQPALYGKPDLAIVQAVPGYLTTADTASFVPSPTVPSTYRPAIRFVVQNIGTNVSGTWDFSATLPTSPAFTYNSAQQISFMPGDRIDYVLSFDRPLPGTGNKITITLDPSNLVSESNKSNNTSTMTIDIQ